MSLIRISHLFKIYGPHPQQAVRALQEGQTKDEIRARTRHTVALHDVSVEIERGETFVVMGLSGSGKSTLVRCLNRLIEPTAGEILVGGRDVLAMDEAELRDLRRHRMSMVFQHFGLLPHRSVLDNVAYGLWVQGVGAPERQERAHQWLETVGLGDYAECRPTELSGGMQQRVGLARALCTDPEILLMDEAFSALDPLIRREMQDELIDLQGTLHKTIVFITHDLDEALRLGDRIAILKDGRVVQVGTPEEILIAPADDYVAEFTADVNLVPVLTARSLMIRPRAVVSPRSGPRVALRLMEREGIPDLFVVNRENRLVGLVTMGDAVEAARRGETHLEALARPEVLRATPETVMDELLKLAAASEWPIAVVDGQERLLGIIPRTVILSALAGELRTNGQGAADPQALPRAAVTMS